MARGGRLRGGEKEDRGKKGRGKEGSKGEGRGKNGSREGGEEGKRGRGEVLFYYYFFFCYILHAQCHALSLIHMLIHTYVLSLPPTHQFVLPLIIHLVDAIINRRLRFGYDIGKGFVVGEEEMLLSFDRIGSVVHKNIAQELRRRAESTRLSVIQSLGESTPCCS